MYQVIRFSLFIASSIFHELVLTMLRGISHRCYLEGLCYQQPVSVGMAGRDLPFSVLSEASESVSQESTE